MDKFLLAFVVVLLGGCATVRAPHVDPRCVASDPGDDRTPDELGCVENERGNFVLPEARHG